MKMGIRFITDAHLRKKEMKISKLMKLQYYLYFFSIKKSTPKEKKSVGKFGVSCCWVPTFEISHGQNFLTSPFR